MSENSKVSFDYDKTKNAIVYLENALEKIEKFKSIGIAEIPDHNGDDMGAGSISQDLEHAVGKYNVSVSSLHRLLDFILEDMQNVLNTMQNYDQTSNEISTTNNSEGSLSIAPETMDSTKSEETDLYSSGFDEDLEHL